MKANLTRTRRNQALLLVHGEKLGIVVVVARRVA